MNVDRVELVVLDALADRTARHVMELSDRTGEHPVAVDLACARLHDSGDIVPIGLGRYEITDRGHRRSGDAPADRRRGEPTT